MRMFLIVYASILISCSIQAMVVDVMSEVKRDQSGTETTRIIRYLSHIKINSIVWNAEVSSEYAAPYDPVTRFACFKGTISRINDVRKLSSWDASEIFEILSCHFLMQEQAREKARLTNIKLINQTARQLSY